MEVLFFSLRPGTICPTNWYRSTAQGLGMPLTYLKFTLKNPVFKRYLRALNVVQRTWRVPSSKSVGHWVKMVEYDPLWVLWDGQF